MTYQFKLPKPSKPTRGVGHCFKCNQLQPMLRVEVPPDNVMKKWRKMWFCSICGKPSGQEYPPAAIPGKETHE